MTTLEPDAPRVRSLASRWLRRALYATGGLTLAGAAMVGLAPAASAQESPPATGPVGALLGGVGDLVGAAVAPVVAPVAQAVAPPPAAPAPAPAPAAAPAQPVTPAPATPAASSSPDPAPATPAATPPAGLATALAAVTAPVAEHLVQPVTTHVQPLVDGVTEQVVAPVARATGPLSPVVHPVREDVVTPLAGDVLSPVGDALAPVLDPLADALRPVARPVADGVLGPVARAVGGTPAGGLLDPALGEPRPVVSGVLPAGTTAPGPLPAVLDGPPGPSAAGVTWWLTQGDHRRVAALRATDAGDDATTPTRATAVAAASPGDQRPAASPAGGGQDRPSTPAPSAPAPAGSGASGSPLRSPAAPDVLAVLTAAALVLDGSRLLAVARGRVELPLRLREVLVSPA
jgi:hypothetical protein